MVSTIFSSYINSIDTHKGVTTINSTHMLVVFSDAVGQADFHIITYNCVDLNPNVLLVCKTNLYGH